MPDGKSPSALGSITTGGQKYTLGSDWRWTGPSPLIVELLDESFTPARFPAGGAAIPVGYEAVAAAAKQFRDPAPELPAFQDSATGGDVVR